MVVASLPDDDEDEDEEEEPVDESSESELEEELSCHQRRHASAQGDTAT